MSNNCQMFRNLTSKQEENKAKPRHNKNTLITRSFMDLRSNSWYLLEDPWPLSFDYLP